MEDLTCYYVRLDDNTVYLIKDAFKKGYTVIKRIDGNVLTLVKPNQKEDK